MARLRRQSIALCAVALVLLAAGCRKEADPAEAKADQAYSAASAGDDSAAADADQSDSGSAETAGADAAAVSGLGAGPTRKPPPRPTTTPTRRVTKSPPRRPTTEKLPPPVPKPAPSAGCTRARYLGAQATKADVKAALTDASTRVYWPTSAPSIRVPLDLVKATAYQESGWQSNVIACDGGIGLMQLMPDTVTFVNQRFEKTYDVNAYRDNALLGANYLAWLIKYFGDVYFEADYSVDPADCADHRDLCLLNAVIAAYNFGPYAVDTEAGLVIPNPQYVDNVRSLMTMCPCLTW